MSQFGYDDENPVCFTKRDTFHVSKFYVHGIEQSRTYEIAEEVMWFDKEGNINTALDENW